jgi:hypothetical protein
MKFKKGADPNNFLIYSGNNTCNWKGVGCSKGGTITRYEVHNSNLQGKFPPQTLSKLTKLRIINLNNNSFSGPIPNLSPLKNLKVLLLSQNNFFGSFLPSILILRRLVSLSLSHNNFTGNIPFELIGLNNLISLNLSFNHFTGSFPPLNQTYLKILDVSNNDFSGALPSTKTLSLFKPTSFSKNPSLCGEIIHKECPHHHGHAGFMLPLIISIIIFAITSISIFSIIFIKNKNKSGGVAGIGNKFKKHLQMVYMVES